MAPDPIPDPILVIDLQIGMFDGLAEPPIHDAEAIAARAGAVIGWARAAGRPVAFIRHDASPGDPLAPGAPGWPVWPALGQAAGEPTFGKTVADAFSNPALAAWVGGAEGVILLGAQTDECVAGTVSGALARGLRVTVVADAHSTPDWPGRPAAKVIAAHNARFAEQGVVLVTAAALTEA